MNKQQIPTEQQLELIRQQIGRAPDGTAYVAHATEKGVPVVLQMRGWVKNKPFPTLYWLCSKDLDKAISRIEATGVIKQLEQRLAEDEDFRAAYLLNQKQYSDKRWQEMTDEDRAHIAKLGIEESFRKSGIGGIEQHDMIRCLHMNYAHHLVDGNVVGAWLDEHYQLNELTITI